MAGELSVGERLTATSGQTYEVEERVSGGPLGTLYRGTAPGKVPSDVAIQLFALRDGEADKFLPKLVTRLERLARASPAHIVPMLDCGNHEGSVFAITEWVPAGRTLERVIAQRGEPFAVEETLDVMHQVADGLQSAVDAGAMVAHHNLNPANVIDVGAGTLKITGVGIVESAREAGLDLLSYLSPAYLAPEQIDSRGSVDIRADLYALGCIGFEMLAGRLPFEGKTQEVAMKHLREPVPAIPHPDVSDRVRGIIERCMAKNPEDRFASPQELLLALHAARGKVGIFEEETDHPMPEKDVSTSDVEQLRREIRELQREMRDLRGQLAGRPTPEAPKRGGNFFSALILLVLLLAVGLAGVSLPATAPIRGDGLAELEGQIDRLESQVADQRQLQARLYSDLGWFYRDPNALHEKALIAFQAAVQYDPDLARAHEGLGWTYWSLGRFEEALDAFRRALDLDETLINAYNGIGFSYLGLEDCENAIPAFNRVLEAEATDIEEAEVAREGLSECA